MGRLIIVGLILVISGCDTTKCLAPKIEYQKVYVEVPVVPSKPPKYDKVDLPIYHLSKGIKPSEISEAYYN